MGLLDGLLAQVAENVDVANLATKVGISPELAESAIQALAHAHVAPTDTVATAAESTGLSADVIQQIIGHIGGEGSLAQFASLFHAGAGAEGGIAGALGGLFGAKE
jgi:hypothetical protein